MNQQNNVKRILGMDFDGKPIFAPKHSHSLLLAAAGGGKTTCGAMPWLQTLIPDQERAIIVNDCKDGEMAAQSIEMCLKAGRKVAIVDPFGLFGKKHPYHDYVVSLNPFGGAVDAFKREDGSYLFAVDNVCHALIEEPADGDAKNKYWRDEPQVLIEFGLSVLLERDPKRATPGGLWSLLSDPEEIIRLAKIEADEGGRNNDETLKALARHVLGMSENKEHWPQHRAAAAKALRIYAANSPLHFAGIDADVTHAQLIREHYVVFLVGPVKYMERLGPDYALQLQSFMEVVLSGSAPPVTFILDEFTNAPLKEIIGQLTTMRGYGANCLMIAQSRSEIERKYGKKETETLEENAVIKQWFGFSSFTEAERISRAMGETMSVTSSMGVTSENPNFSGNISTNKERLFTPDMLMSLPTDEQILHVKDVGFIHCTKIRQNELAPSCYYLTDNPLEGGRLPPDPKVTFIWPGEQADEVGVES